VRDMSCACAETLAMRIMNAAANIGRRMGSPGRDYMRN
jgi:hypothetical protein